MTITITGARQLPELEPNRTLTVPPGVDVTLPNGLTVIAIERRSVPLVEVRLRIPYETASLDRTFLARSAMLGRTLFSGTTDMSTVEIAAALQSVGGGLSAGVDPDRMAISGASLASGLDRMLDILAQVLDGAVYPDSEVATQKARMIDRINLALSQPTHLVRVALLRRIYGDTHPYAVQTADVADVADVSSADLLAMHAERISPVGAVLTIVGDIDAQATVELAGKRLGGWRPAGTAARLPDVPPLAGGPVLLEHRGKSVQSSIRMALPAVGRTHPDHQALVLANLVFGGYFSSRLVENVREDKGYSYGPHSGIEHGLAGSRLVISLETGTEVTVPALLETWYELGRMATVGPTDAEVDQARQFALGSLLLGLSTQSGLASMASVLAGFGLRLDFLVGHAQRLAEVSRDEVAQAAARYLGPSGAAVVVLGDADVVAEPLRRLSIVEQAGD